MTNRRLPSCAASLALLAAASGPSAHAAFTITLLEDGGDVVGMVAGSANLEELTFAGSPSVYGLVFPEFGMVLIGSSHLQSGVSYTGFTSPGPFGSGAILVTPSSGTGCVGFSGDPSSLVLPTGYVSGDPLAATATWSIQTFATLGLTPGTYTWTWGSGANADSATLQIGPVPEPGQWALLSSLGLLGLAMWRRRVCR